MPLEMTPKLVARIAEAICGTIVFSCVVGGIDSSGRPRDYDFLFSIGVVALILAVVRGYYENAKHVKPPHPGLPLALDVSMLLLTLISVICALASDVISTCSDSFPPLFLDCDSIYAAIAFAFGLFFVYIFSTYLSYQEYQKHLKENNNSSNEWTLPMNSYPFWFRIAQCVLCIIAIGTCTSMVRNSSDPILGAFTMILAIAGLTLIISILWIVLWDLPKAEPPHKLIDFFIIFCLAILSFVASIHGSKNDQLRHCSNFKTNFKCGSMVGSVVMIWFLFAVQFVYAIYTLYTWVKNKSDDPSLNTTNTNNNPTPVLHTDDKNPMWLLGIRVCAAITGFLSFAIVIGAFEQLTFQGAGKLMVSSGFIAFAVQGLLMIQFHYLKKPLPHGLLRIHLDLLLFILAFVSVILVNDSPEVKHCDTWASRISNFNCHAYIAGLAFHYVLLISLAISLLYSAYIYRNHTDWEIKDYHDFIIRHTQVIFAIIVLSTAAACIPSVAWLREIQLDVAIGIISAFCSYIWIVKHHLLGWKVSFPIIPLAFDGIMFLLNIIAAIALVVSDELKYCNGIGYISCGLIKTAAAFTFLLSFTYLFSAIYGAVKFQTGNSEQRPSDGRSNAIHDESVAASPTVENSSYQEMEGATASPTTESPDNASI